MVPGASTAKTHQEMEQERVVVPPEDSSSSHNHHDGLGLTVSAKSSSSLSRMSERTSSSPHHSALVTSRPARSTATTSPGRHSSLVDNSLVPTPLSSVVVGGDHPSSRVASLSSQQPSALREAAIEKVLVDAQERVDAACGQHGGGAEPYAQEHRLPGVFGLMLEDMLKEKPRQAKLWMQQWFEAYAVQQQQQKHEHDPSLLPLGGCNSAACLASAAATGKTSGSAAA